ncbi:MAG: hypothetical protein ACPG4T_14895 [Nannocystaceae bacterium]
MNLKDVREALVAVEEDLMGGLAATDVFSTTSGMSIAGINSSPKSCALFNVVCQNIEKTIAKSGLPVPQYLAQTIIRLGANGEVIICIVDINKKYRWGLAVDSSKAQMGILVSVVMPETTDRLRKALADK